MALTGCGGPKETGTETKAAPAASSTPTPKAPVDLVAFKEDAPELHDISVHPVSLRPMPADEVTAPARIEANSNRLGSAILPAPGRIEHVLVKLGDSVKAGQPLVTVRTAAAFEAQASYLEADGAVRQAELAVAKADADLVRLTDLLEHQAVAQKEVLAARTTAALTKGTVEVSQTTRQHALRRLELLGLKPGQFDQAVVVHAPISGKILELNVVEGELRNEINEPLMKIADLSRVWATSEVPESKIRFCKVGGTATLDLIAYPGEEFRARVTRIADTVNSETRTVKVTAELDNPVGRLRPDMFGSFRYVSGTTDRPWIPDAAVVRIGEKDYVFVAESRSRFRARAVELGKHHEGGYVVLNGLDPGNRIVTAGAVYLKGAL